LSDYRLAFFDEIHDPYKVTLIFQLSLYWPAIPKLLRELRSNDDRYTREFGIFAVMQDGTVAGGLLLMRISTQTTQGMLEVGGINAVSTRPDFARRGLMTAITNRAHEYFLERGLEYSVLTSSKRLVAMTMYQQLGYGEIDHSEVAVKYPNQPHIPSPKDTLVRPFSETDVDSIDSVYKRAVEGSTGFIYRPKNFLKARNYTSGCEIKSAENMRVVERGDSVTGYAYWQSNPRISEAPEIMAFDEVSFSALLADVERRNPDGAVMVWSDGLTDLETSWLRKAGYQGPLEAYGRFLVKSLKQNTDPNRIRKMYGVELGKFRMGLWDGT
jgi:GNAT superfamily N-acetyltransferase